MRWLESITDSMGMNPSKLQEIMKHRRAWHTVIHGVTKSWTCIKRRKNNNNKTRRLVCIHLHLCSLPLSLHMYMCEVHMATCAGNGLESERCMKPPGQQLVESMKIVGNYRFTRHEVCTDERRAGQRPHKSSQETSATRLSVTYRLQIQIIYCDCWYQLFYFMVLE